MEQPLRTELFGEIARRLKPGGILASADLASELGSDEYEALLHAWMTMMAGAGIPADKQNQIRDAYAKDVAILPPAKVESIIKSAGFYLPVQFFQAGLIHAWFAKRQM